MIFCNTTNSKIVIYEGPNFVYMPAQLSNTYHVQYDNPSENNYCDGKLPGRYLLVVIYNRS